MPKRRPNGAGTITKRSDGRYQGAAYVTDPDGHRVRWYRYGSTWDEAAEKLAKLQEQERNGVPVPARAWKVSEWLNYWLEHIVAPSTEYNPYTKYEGRQALPGAVPREEVTDPAHAFAGPRSALARMKKDEVPAPTRAENPRVLRNALNRARREELVVRNVAEFWTSTHTWWTTTSEPPPTCSRSCWKGRN
jgi:hypothetical protein